MLSNLPRITEKHDGTSEVSDLASWLPLVAETRASWGTYNLGYFALRWRRKKELKHQAYEQGTNGLTIHDSQFRPM